jgi:hypothetical protein
MCHLTQACSTYTDLWEYSFGFFVSQYKNYAILPVSSFAVDNAQGSCDLYIANVNATESYPNRVILGSMFFSQFTAYYETDYTNSSMPMQALNMTVNPTFAQPTTYVGQRDIYFSSEGLFDYQPNIVVPIVIDDNMNAFVRANLGAQGYANFQLSFNNGYFYTFGDSCTSPKGSCEDAPYFAQNYFSQAGYREGTEEDFLLDEKRNYVQGILQNQVQVCLETTEKDFCLLPGSNV